MIIDTVQNCVHFVYELSYSFGGTDMALVSFTDLRQHMARYFDRVTEDREPLVVTRQGGKGNLVVMSEEEFSGWQETVHLLNSPKNAERLMASIRQIKAGGALEKELFVFGKTDLTA